MPAPLLEKHKFYRLTSNNGILVYDKPTIHGDSVPCFFLAKDTEVLALEDTIVVDRRKEANIRGFTLVFGSSKLFFGYMATKKNDTVEEITDPNHPPPLS